ncbi:MAG: glucosamine-6-phosphate deaminase [Acidimicrobiales bacterium]|jgi:glucosamine-6-phosphate deaminase
MRLPGSPDVNGPGIEVLDSPAALASAAADEAAAVIESAVARNGTANAMFATGNSQLAFVDALVDPSRDLPWAHVTVFHMDEYVGIGPDHPASFERWIRQRIVERARPGAAYYLDGLAVPDVECDRYAGLLATHPLDLCCLGIGENGHLAFNDPGVADFEDPRDVKVVELDQACRRQQVGEGHFAVESEVPGTAVTVTVPALLRATRVLAVVPEARKAVPVRDALLGPVSVACPASILQRMAHATVYLDADSAALL